MDQTLPLRTGIVSFGEFRLVPAARLLTRNGAAVKLGDRALDILITLAERRGQIISSRTLLELVWPGLVVEASNLRVHIAALRKVLGDGGEKRIITSVPGRGYMFQATTEEEVALAAPPAERRAVLPVTLNRVIGREAEVADIVQALPLQRFITVTGAGGIGKTALALAVAEASAAAYRDGTLFVDLAPLSSPILVAAHLASLLRLPASDKLPLQDITAHLRAKNLLLILDNCEHVIEAASCAAEDILKWAPEVHILATSREALRAQGEWVHRLAPLAVPPHNVGLTAAAARQFAAIQLFLERVRAQDASLEIADADVLAAAEICASLDGLPLAIELAATRVPLFGIRGLAGRLNDRFTLLTKGRRTATGRHQTLGAMIEWSYQLLDDAEKLVWRRLSVFSGVFSFAAASAIGRTGLDEQVDIADILGSLAEKSLVTVEMRGGEACYRMLESLRLYAFGLLLEHHEANCVRQRHAEYFYEQTLGAGDNEIETRAEAWPQAHKQDIDDIRAALNWAFSRDGDPVLAVKLMAASVPVWFKLLLVPELRMHLERALLQAQAYPDEIGGELVMRLYIALGHSLFHTLGPARAVSESLEKAFVLAARNGDVSALLHTLWALFENFSTKGNYVAAMDCIARLDTVRETFPAARETPMYDCMSALGHHLLGAQELALTHARRALAYPAIQNRRDGVFMYDHKTAASSHLARILWVGGQPDQAGEVIRTTVADAVALDQPFALGYFLVLGACPVSLWRGDHAAARGFAALLKDTASAIAFNVWQAGARFYEQILMFLEAGAAQHEARNRLLNDASLTGFQAGSLATYHWALLRPEIFTAATNGPPTWATTEILRAEGEGLLYQAGPEAAAAAENLFRQALEIARAQKALSWELRTATSLARLWQGRQRVAARDILGEVLSRVTEGFGTSDLVAARTLLNQLG